MGAHVEHCFEKGFLLDEEKRVGWGRFPRETGTTRCVRHLRDGL